MNCNDAQDAFSLFHSVYVKLYNECFPVITIKSTYKNRKTWLTDTLKQAIKEKNRLYIQSIKHKTIENELRYHNYKKILKRLMNKAEKEHYDNLFKENVNNLKKSWSIIKEVINRKKSSASISKFLINGNIVEDNKIICEGFNDFYINVGPTLAAKIPHFPKSPVDYLPASNPNSIFLDPVTSEEVEKLVLLLKNSSPGWDDMDAKIIKKTYTLYLPILVHLTNLSLTKGIFPNQLKLARVVALFKSDDRMLVNNYRPVSILPVLSKLYERIMYNRLLKFINKHNLLYKFQFGFREQHGTDIALIVLIDKIMQAFNDGEMVLGVFLDLSKAFDTVNHEILLNKLYHYGIRGVANDWFKSYLSNRKQYVSYNDCCSSQRVIKCGVPQGSILGPLLFLLYVNDMVNASQILFSILFADDTNVFITGKNINTLVETMNNELHKLYEWMCINKLSLNIKKTKFMVFTMRKSKEIDQTITINNQVIEQVNNFKFLGVIIDSHLRWTDHVQHIRKKISKGLGILYKAKRVLNLTTLLTLYYSFIYPYLLYCIEVWGNASKDLMLSLMKLQKRAMRLIKSVPMRTESEPLFKSLELLSVFKLYTFKIGVFMFKFTTSMVAQCVKELFKRTHEIHSRSTRQKDKLYVPFTKLETVRKSVRYRGVTIWNHITDHLNLNCSIYSYKHSLKKYLLNHEILL